MKVVLILLIFENIVWGSKCVPGSSRSKLRGFDIHKKSGNQGGSISKPLILRQYVDYYEEHFSTKNEDRITTDDVKTESGPTEKISTEKNPTEESSTAIYPIEESSTAKYPLEDSSSAKTTTIGKHSHDHDDNDDENDFDEDEYVDEDDFDENKDDYRTTPIMEITTKQSYETEKPTYEDHTSTRFTMKQTEETTTKDSLDSDPEDDYDIEPLFRGNTKYKDHTTKRFTMKQPEETTTKDSLDSDPEDDYGNEPLFQGNTKYKYIPVWQGCRENDIVLKKDENATKSDENDQDKRKTSISDNKYGCKLRTGIDINNELRTLRIDKNKLKLRQKGEKRS